MPPPTTLDGLGVLALTAAVAREQFTAYDSSDSDEAMLMALITAILSVTGMALPKDYRGLVFHPEHEV